MHHSTRILITFSTMCLAQKQLKSLENVSSSSRTSLLKKILRMMPRVIFNCMLGIASGLWWGVMGESFIEEVVERFGIPKTLVQNDLAWYCTFRVFELAQESGDPELWLNPHSQVPFQLFAEADREVAVFTCHRILRWIDLHPEFTMKWSDLINANLARAVSNLIEYQPDQALNLTGLLQAASSSASQEHVAPNAPNLYLQARMVHRCSARRC